MRSVISIIRTRLHISLAALSLLVGAALFLNPVPVGASSNKGDCHDMNVPVALAPGLPKNQVIHGELCNPWSSAPDAVDLLVPGATYDSLYWDFPYSNYQYSYVDRTLGSGRATFAIDRIGTGESSKPLSALVTFDADVYTMHQVVEWLRSDRGYSDVTAVGHSMGSIVAVQEAATHHDVDRVVATGFLHSPSINLVLTMGSGLQPAALDPQFAGQGLDLGYMTTAPGQRETAFYSAAADPAVIAYDESHKDIVSLVAAQGAVSQILTPALLNSSQHVTAPVLTIVGNQDILCGSLGIGTDCSSSTTVYNSEKQYFKNAASFSAYVVPGTGHNLPLHPSAGESFDVINQWIKTH